MMADHDQDLVQRLRTVLLAHADTVNTVGMGDPGGTMLSGAELRARAGERSTRARRTVVQSLAAAAVVAVIALVPQLLTGERHHPRREQPGIVTHSVPAPTSATPSPSLSRQTSPAPRSARPTPSTAHRTAPPRPTRPTPTLTPPSAPTGTGTTGSLSSVPSSSGTRPPVAPTRSGR